MIFFYNLLFPLVFIFFIPSMIMKLIKRDGIKDTYMERFSHYNREKKEKFKKLGGNVVWIHAVSVGETQLAIDFIKELKSRGSKTDFVVSTTTTTSQKIAQEKLSDFCTVIFCPVDYFLFIRKTLKLIKPVAVIIFETEIWPAMIYESKRIGARVIQVNARISDHSYKGYKKFASFINPFLSKIDLSCAQTQLDAERLKRICPSLNVVVTGTMKFDQKIPSSFKDISLKEAFGDDDFTYLLVASSHPGEEKFIAFIYKGLIEKFPQLRLVVVPRHAERGTEIASELKSLNIGYLRRSNNETFGEKILCLLADTTGELFAFVNKVDVVIMCKCFVGNTGGHNVIEPALLGKAIVTGHELSNFKFVLKVMKENNALLTADDISLESVLSSLLADKEKIEKLGSTAKAVISEHIGATDRTIKQIEKLISFE